MTTVVPITGDDVTNEAVTKFTTGDSNTSDSITILDGIVPETVTETDLPTTEETSNKERSTVDDISNSPSTDITGTDGEGSEETTASNDATNAPEIQDSDIEDISNDTSAGNEITTND